MKQPLRWTAKTVMVSAAGLFILLQGCGIPGLTSAPQRENAVTNQVQAIQVQQNNAVAINTSQPQTPYQAATVAKQGHPGVTGNSTGQAKAKYRQPMSYPFKVPILEYHDIHYVPKDAWTMDVQQFADEMKFLADKHFTPITLDQLHNTMRHGTPLPPRPIVITFDDGYESNYTNAFPILKRYGFHATIFMISGYVGKHGYLTAAELNEMENSGLVQIESHTVHHKNLAKLPIAQANVELVDSKRQLTALLGRPVNYFCYPEGGVTGPVMLAVQRAGYWAATSTSQGYATAVYGPYLLKRIAIHEGLPLTTFAKLLAQSLVPGTTHTRH